MVKINQNLVLKTFLLLKYQKLLIFWSKIKKKMSCFSWCFHMESPSNNSGMFFFQGVWEIPGAPWKFHGITQVTVVFIPPGGIENSRGPWKIQLDHLISPRHGLGGWCFEDMFTKDG